MQEAFQLGAMEGGYENEGNQVLPEEDIDKSLNEPGSIAYKAVDDNGDILGGAIIVIDKENNHNRLDFLYVKHGVQSKGIGKFIWFQLENLHPETEIWETCTPYFEKRNIHFYVNVCGFKIVEYFNSHHKDPNELEINDESDDGGMFRFEKKMR